MHVKCGLCTLCSGDFTRFSSVCLLHVKTGRLPQPYSCVSAKVLRVLRVSYKLAHTESTAVGIHTGNLRILVRCRRRAAD